MAKYNGTIQRLKVEDTTFKAIAEESTCALNVTINPIDVTTKDSGGWEESIGGLRSWEIEGEMILDWQASATQITPSQFYDFVTGRAAKSIEFTTDVTGDVEFSGAVNFLTFNVNAPMEDKVSATFTARGTGALAKAVIAV